VSWPRARCRRGAQHPFAGPRRMFERCETELHRSTNRGSAVVGGCLAARAGFTGQDIVAFARPSEGKLISGTI